MRLRTSTETENGGQKNREWEVRISEWELEKSSPLPNPHSLFPIFLSSGQNDRRRRKFFAICLLAIGQIQARVSTNVEAKLALTRKGVGYEFKIDFDNSSCDTDRLRRVTGCRLRSNRRAA